MRPELTDSPESPDAFLFSLVLWPMVYGLKPLVLWSLVYGLKPLVLWPMVYGLTPGPMVSGLWTNGYRPLKRSLVAITTLQFL